MKHIKPILFSLLLTACSALKEGKIYYKAVIPAHVQKGTMVVSAKPLIMMPYRRNIPEQYYMCIYNVNNASETSCWYVTQDTFNSFQKDQMIQFD